MAIKFHHCSTKVTRALFQLLTITFQNCFTRVTQSFFQLQKPLNF